MTISEKMRQRGFAITKRVRGREATTDTREALTITVQDVQGLQDPDKPMQAKMPVYTIVTASAGTVADPRVIKLFTETESGRWHKPYRFKETSADRITWVWECEAQRQ